MIFGAGAVGGVVGGRLAQAGFEVALIARGAHYEALRARGLTIEDPLASVSLALDVAPDPGGVDWRDRDIVMLATKSQDSAAALHALQACAPASVPIVCLQNGVENERVALRLFEYVYGAVVMAPTAHLEPGVVRAYGTAATGIIDVGRYPSGLDERCEYIADALGTATFSSTARPDIMRMKYSKLVLNLANAAHAACAPGPALDQLSERAREEGRAVLRAAGIDFTADEVGDVSARWRRLGVREIAGRTRVGSSTWQSLARGTGAVEADYLNGEIVLLGRLHGVLTPVNELLNALAARLAREGATPGTLSADAVLAQLAAEGIPA